MKHINGVQQFGNRVVVAPIKDDFIVDKMAPKNSNESKAEALSESALQKPVNELKAPDTGFNGSNFVVIICNDSIYCCWFWCFVLRRQICYES